MKTQISAIYAATTDKYVASIRKGSTDITMAEENGSDLVDAVKKETGVEIEYDANRRVFLIPEENKFR